MENPLDNWDELLYGRKYSEKSKAFIKALEEIEKSHINFFRNRKPKLDSEEHDRLYNHHMLIYDGSYVTFGFIKDSDLPQYIQNECNEAYRRIWRE